MLVRETIPERVTRIFNSFTQSFTDGMQSIEPSDRTDPKFDEKHRAWQLAFEFPLRLTNYVNDFANTIVLGGKNNDGTVEDTWVITKQFTGDLNNVLNSNEFNEYMEIAKPNIPNDPDYAQKLRAWEKAFDFVRKIRAFISDVEDKIDKNIGSDGKKLGHLTGVGYHGCVMNLIGHLESN